MYKDTLIKIDKKTIDTLSYFASITFTGHNFTAHFIISMIHTLCVQSKPFYF